MRCLAGHREEERGSPSVSVNPLGVPLNVPHEGYHHPPEQHQAANSSEEALLHFPSVQLARPPSPLDAGGEGEALAAAARKNPNQTSPALGSEVTRPWRFLFFGGFQI